MIAILLITLGVLHLENLLPVVQDRQEKGKAKFVRSNAGLLNRNS